MSCNALQKLAGILLLSTLLAAAGSAQDSLIDADQYRGLAADRRAHQVGDLLTVVVMESTRASSRAGSEAANDVRLAVDVRERHASYGVGAGISGANSGHGGTSRAGDVRAQIAVRVLDVDHRGQLLISGEQNLQVNGEVQRIRLSGWIRGEDIAADNSIWSHRISDANIEFTGDGDVTEAQKRSLLYRIFQWLGLV